LEPNLTAEPENPERSDLLFDDDSASDT
jgi:hypothetical protein